MIMTDKLSSFCTFVCNYNICNTQRLHKWSIAHFYLGLIVCFLSYTLFLEARRSFFLISDGGGGV
jgi:hypothetical protein